MEKISVINNENVKKAFNGNEVTINWNGGKLCIKRVLSVSEMLSFVANVVDGCFNGDNNEYTPELMDFVFLREVLDKYTNVDIPTDIEDLYALLYQTDLIDVVLDNVNGRQFNKMYAAIMDKVKFITNTNATKVVSQMEEIAAQAKALVDNFSGLLNDVTAEDINSLIAAIANLGSLDEGKLVEAVIAHQEEAK